MQKWLGVCELEKSQVVANKHLPKLDFPHIEKTEPFLLSPKQIYICPGSSEAASVSLEMLCFCFPHKLFYVMPN